MICSRLFLSLALLSTGLPAQRLDPSVLLKPLAAAWPTYNGEYSGRRYSALAQINATNVRSLSLQWIFRTKDAGSAWTIKSTPLETGGILYFTVPNNVWAVDARTGREIWHYKYPANEAIVIGNPATGKTLWHVNAAEFSRAASMWCLRRGIRSTHLPCRIQSYKLSEGGAPFRTTGSDALATKGLS